MKKLILIALLGAVMVACATMAQKQIAKMQSSADVIEAVCVGDELVIGDSTISADIRVTFPSNYFFEDVVMRITPLLIYDGHQLAAPPKYLEGSYVKGDSQVISWKTGGSYTQHVEFPLQEGMTDVVLELKTEILATCYDTTIDFRQLAPPIVLKRADLTDLE